MKNLSRRGMLQAVASFAPLWAGGRTATALLRFGEAGSAQAALPVCPSWEREAVRHIRRGDVTAEAYVTRLLAQCEAHQSLNLANAIDAARILEAARRSGARAPGRAARARRRAAVRGQGPDRGRGLSRHGGERSAQRVYPDAPRGRGGAPRRGRRHPDLHDVASRHGGGRRPDAPGLLAQRLVRRGAQSVRSSPDSQRQQRR